jgi:spore germination cell wall hydrolase CwlJ-like protein
MAIDFNSIPPYMLEAATLFAEGDKSSLKNFETDIRKISSVIGNRTLRPNRFGATRQEVILAPDQFTGVGSDEFMKPIEGRLTKEEELYFKKCMQVAGMAQRGELKDEANGADHYYNPKISNPAWGKVYPSVDKSSGHKFLKEVPLDKNGKPLKTKKK